MLEEKQATDSPFHPGEQAVQARLGVRDIEVFARRVVRDHLPEQHRLFYEGLPFLVAAARDAEGRPWATLLAGPEGFVAAPDDRGLTIDAAPAPGDALDGALAAGADLGLLGIELATRRRNRVNGRIAEDRGAGAGQALKSMRFEVDQSFGNCPQYIRERAWRWDADTPAPSAERRSELSASQRRWIAEADTFFIASGYRGAGESPTFGMDASHRGGDPGFVEVLDGRRIRFPDYAGNNHFNTIGNLSVDPRAGFLFVDFATGSLLQLTGTVTIDWGSEAVTRIPGARRLVTLTIDAVVEVRHAVALRWEEEAEAVRELRVVEKIRESDDVTSFLLSARDGGPLPSFEPGQHLPIELPIPGQAAPVARSYSLSSAPSDPVYRITVKREPQGLASGFMHDQIAPGAVIAGRRPGGDFTLPHGGGPVVLISAGVGVTPMASLLRDAVASGAERPIWFLHGARDGAHHPLAAEIRALAAAAPMARLQVYYSRPRPQDRQGIDYHHAGRVNGAAAAAMVRDPSAEYLICGPVAFMASIQADLEASGVSPDRIHSETFGPSG